MSFSTLYHTWYKYGTKINKITINTNKPHTNKKLAIRQNNKLLLINPNRSLFQIFNFYFPMQNRENIEPKTSSEVISPTIVPRW